jgi:ATP-binding cassette subfamily F protein 3
MVSHDRHLLTTVTDRFLLVAGGRVQDFDGDLDDYARWLARNDSTGAQAANQQASDTPPPPGKTRTAPAPKPAPQSSASGAAAAQRRRDSADQRKALAPVRSRLARVEKRMQELGAEAATLDTQLADPALYEPGARIRQLDLAAQRARVAQETEQVEAEWLELNEQLERAAGGS